MGVGSARFSSAGQVTEHYIPGVYSRRNTVSAGTGVSSGNLCIIGSSTNGEPLKLLCVSDVAEAKEALGGGALLQAVGHAFKGSNTYIPQQVFCMRVDKATRGELSLKKGGDEVIHVTSAMYGTGANQVRLRYVDDGTIRRVMSIAKDGTACTSGAIDRQSLAIACANANATNITCTVNANGITLSAADDNGVIDDAALMIKAEEYTTLSELVSVINDSEKWIAQAVDVRPSAKAELDYGTFTEAQTITLNSNVAALLEALELLPDVSKAELTGERMLPDSMTSYVRFAGGSEEAADGERWQAALDVLAGEDIQIIATPSDDSTVRALIAAHCIEMSTVEKKRERTFYCGLPAGTSLEDGVEAAKALNTELGSVIITGATAVNPITGATEQIPPAMLACKCAGMEAAMGVSNPLTNKAINVSAFDRKYKISEMNTMIKGGVIPFGENDDGQLVCIRAVTAYQDDNLILNERSFDFDGG